MLLGRIAADRDVSVTRFSGKGNPYAWASRRPPKRVIALDIQVMAMVVGAGCGWQFVEALPSAEFKGDRARVIARPTSARRPIRCVILMHHQSCSGQVTTAG